jgi:hypothetical protein
MKKKVIIFLIANILMTYLLLVGLGWLAFAICGGNPTFLIPLPVLLLVFFILDLVMIRMILTYFKIFSFNTFLIGASEVALLYILVLFAYH